MTTELGRVVYDRKKHTFSEKDIFRIAKAYCSELEAEKLVNFLNEFIILMLQELTRRYIIFLWTAATLVLTVASRWGIALTTITTGVMEMIARLLTAKSG